MGRALRLLGWLLLATAAALALGLGLAHRNIRRFAGPLPTVDAIVAAAPASDLPVRLVAVDTASQVLPRSLVLDAERDPTPGAPYRMSHPAFLFEWSDGRRLLVDAGMEPEAAIAFGAPTERLGGEPTTAHGSAAEQLGPLVETGPLAVVFTHLHSDHVQGLGALCRARGGSPIDVVQSPAQAGSPNYTTRPGVRLVDEAGCARRVRLEGALLAPVPERPGVFVIHVAGHTPGSQVVIAFLDAGAGRVRRIALAGDAANALDGVLYDVPKPLLYRLVVVPESDARLGEVRRLLAALGREGGFELAVSHDALALERDGFLPPR